MPSFLELGGISLKYKRNSQILSTDISKSIQRRILYCKEPSIDGFRGFKIVKRSVRFFKLHLLLTTNFHCVEHSSSGCGLSKGHFFDGLSKERFMPAFLRVTYTTFLRIAFRQPLSRLIWTAFFRAFVRIAFWRPFSNCFLTAFLRLTFWHARHLTHL